jgi:hypothetical protein
MAMIEVETTAAAMAWDRGANPVGPRNAAAGQSGQNRCTPHGFRNPEERFTGNNTESPHFFAPAQFIDRSVD